MLFEIIVRSVDDAEFEQEASQLYLPPTKEEGVCPRSFVCLSVC